VQIDESAPVTARREIGVAASREIVWELLTTMDKWADWNPDVKTASQPALEKGGVFRWKAGPASLTSTLAEVDRPTQLGWTGTSMGMQAVHVWHLETDGTGTLARTEESWSGTLPRMLPGMMRRSLEKTLDSWLTHLKAEAEAQSMT
jgi:uncharacterized protein YndB with AHSA1/START domain